MGEASLSPVYTEDSVLSRKQSFKPSFTDITLQTCRRTKSLLDEDQQIFLDGQSLDLGAVVAVARHGCKVAITTNPEVLRSLEESVNLLNQKLTRGEIVYGVNTGFGGSADSRTNNYTALQKALIQHQSSAVLLPTDRGRDSSHLVSLHTLKSHSIPIPVVRAAMLVRCNSLLRGHSAVRPQVIEYILAFLCKFMTPVVPLRGTISASGDLMPLSYIAGALEGNPDISIHKENGEIIGADQALSELGLEPLEFGPKEGLGLLNGTAFSCGAASLVMFEAKQLVLLSQLLTAMGTEAMKGMICNYHPFIAAVRPHDGQIEAADNIFNFLYDSKLATPEGPAHDGLAQDRYALRTATQWVGPNIENMALAFDQIRAELNSTTDNPLINPADGNIHHGGNFQATAITSSMEKTLSAMQMIGRMIFSQCSELINPALSNGLPPNLSMDDPSLSFAFKGIDINMASYTSELGYLNHPISNHVQSAEMHNQGINSLAFISCRYAGDAVEVLSLMLANYLYVLCQAVDQRVLQAEFIKDVRPRIENITSSLFPLVAPAHLEKIQTTVWGELMHHWDRSSTKDLRDRSLTAANCSVGILLDQFSDTGISQDTAVSQWKSSVANTLQQSYEAARTTFLANPPTKEYLCSTSQKLYTFVRDELKVPTHRGIEAHPTYNREKSHGKECIGSQVSKVYIALREGKFGEILTSCW
ncbi:L-Aspartase-like protein [Penicillium longicatenatum]|uniref:L-Aspartase-like protein n=1 Tax=Penicillium longicatenatum TaxID=1561947 RepID=UPI002546B7D6|nr:L-Aspartase-like protein [Penicillium longicatenatum]KAJ5631129.1 L-Aspartase-like protein [Penicillium longicatenatum]